MVLPEPTTYDLPPSFLWSNSVVKLPVLLISLCLLAGCAQQAAQEPPPPAPKPPLEFLGEWGTPGNGPGQLSDPSDLAVDSVGNVYISDRGSRFVHKFSATGTPLLSFQYPSLREPACIALDRGDAIYVCDRQRKAVYTFLPTGDFLRVLRGRDMLPSDVAVDGEGNVFVAGGIRIFHFTPRGRLGHAWGTKGGGPGMFLWTEDVQVSLDGSVFVLDPENARLQRFTSQGEFLGEWPTGSTEAASALALSGNSILLARPISHSLEVWTLDGRRVLSVDLRSHFAPSGTESKEYVGALAASPKGELFVLIRNPARPRVLRFRINF